MSDFTATIQGGEELMRKFKELSDAVAQDALESAAIAGALPILNAAKKNAPKKTRTLSRSLHIGNHTDKSDEFGTGEDADKYSDIGGATESADSASILVGTNLVYAAIQEYGGTVTTQKAPWLKFKLKDGTWRQVKTVTIPAHPYLRPALDEKKDEAIDAAGRALWALIERAAL